MGFLYGYLKAAVRDKLYNMAKEEFVLTLPGYFPVFLLQILTFCISRGDFMVCTKPANDCCTIPNMPLLQKSIINTFIQSQSFFVVTITQCRNIHKHLKLKRTSSFWTVSSRLYYLEKQNIVWKSSEFIC